MPIVPYFTAQGNCEGTPHGSVHVSIGGWMGSVPTAAQDPIFSLHHANIDRLWNAWLKQGGGRTDPLTDVAWKTTKFLFFDENGAQKWMTGCDVLRAAEQLNYTYQNEGDAGEGVLPEDPAVVDLSRRRPSSDSPYYVGNIALFGHGIRDVVLMLVAAMRTSRSGRPGWRCGV